MTSRPTLDSIGVKNDTDKSSKHHDYLRFYEQFVGRLRDEPITVVELGINKGGSLRTWEEYFTQATVIGVDIKEKWVNQGFARAKTILGDCGNSAFLSDLVQTYEPTVLLDDASHFWSHQVAAFEATFEHLQSGAYFIMEDVNTSFGGLRRKPYSDQRQDAFLYFSKLTTVVCGTGWQHPLRDVMPTTKRQTELAHLVDFIAFYPKTILIRRK